MIISKKSFSLRASKFSSRARTNLGLPPQNVLRVLALLGPRQFS